MRLTALMLAAGLLTAGRAGSVVAAPVGVAASATGAASAAAGIAGPELPASSAASVSAASATAAASAAAAQPESGLQPSLSLAPLPKGDAARALPSVLQAKSILSEPDFLTVADGNAEFRRGDLVIHADRLTYNSSTDLATARGKVLIHRAGAIYSGPETQLEVQRFEGFFLEPVYDFPQFGSGGKARRVDFIDDSRSVATDAQYTSCVRDGPDEPDWLLRADSVNFDLDAKEGVAKGAVLHFLGLPILALPTLSFPLSEERRSGWLPPSLDTDNRSGIEISVPYYWDIAPNRDATLTPRIITRRGFGADGEFRYLEPGLQGVATMEWLPFDRLTGTSREALHWRHDGDFADGLRLSIDAAHVSDDDWWKDFPDPTRSLTPRLLEQRISLERPFSFSGGQGLAYARADGWQVLQGSDADATVVGPYQRSPQVGVRLGGGLEGGWRYNVQTEYNRFTLPAGDAARDGRLGGARWDVLGDLSWPWRHPGWFVVPQLSVNAASYSSPGLLPSSRRSSRVIPSASLDVGLDFERDTQAFGHAFHQTMEPRMLYVFTPYRAQSQLPNYDSAEKDFNFSSVYTINQFSGVDRVSDGNLLTAGLTSRFIDAGSGIEALRLGIAQRYLLSQQHETALADGTPDGPPAAPHLSDLLLLGSTSLVPHWSLNSTLDYSPSLRKTVNSVLGAAYNPGPFRALNLSYRLAAGQSKQFGVGWQWPIWSRNPEAGAWFERPGGTGGHCVGTWYSMGSLNFSSLDNRVTSSVVGFEYDAGCWIARMVAERVSTGASQATTRLLFQLELVGLSRLGSNALQVLKDNVPGYRLLRDPTLPGTTPDPRLSAPPYE